MMKPFIKAKSEQAVVWVAEEWIKLTHEGGFLNPQKVKRLKPKANIDLKNELNNEAKE